MSPACGADRAGCPFSGLVMRISVDPYDPGHAVWRAMKRRGLAVDVTVDGQVVKNCVTLDTKRRLVVAHGLDEKGQLQLNARRDAVKLRQLSGNVAIHIRRA